MKKNASLLLALLFLNFTGLTTASQQETKKVDANSNAKKVEIVQPDVEKDSKCGDCKGKMTCKSEMKKDSKCDDCKDKGTCKS